MSKIYFSILKILKIIGFLIRKKKRREQGRERGWGERKEGRRGKGEGGRKQARNNLLGWQK